MPVQSVNDAVAGQPQQSPQQQQLATSNTHPKGTQKAPKPPKPPIYPIPTRSRPLVLHAIYIMVGS